MQSVSSAFSAATIAPRRKLAKRALFAFLKTYAPTTRFFTIGVSSIGGPDPISGTGAVLQEWDKYNYEDYTDRIIDMEVTREMDMYGSMIKAMADVTMANADGKFTPGKDVGIGAYILPWRPLKLFWGFDNEAIPMFTGMTEKMPAINEERATAQFHGIDFMQTIMNIPLDQAVMYENKWTNEIISDLLVNHAGLATAQFVLDQGMNKIRFAYFKKDAKLGDIIQDLCTAELASFFQDELGIFRFWNRQHGASAAAVWSFNEIDNVVESNPPDVENVINVVEVNSLVREVQAKQKLWESTGATEIKPGETATIFADFSDDFGDLPVTAVDAPLYISSATTSSFETNADAQGTGDTLAGQLTLTSSTRFATSYMMQFTNGGTQTIFLTKLILWAKPAKVISEIYHRESDSTSIAKYDERYVQINNDFIQDLTFAKTISKMLIEDRKEPAGVRDLEIKGVPQLQLGDVVNYNDGVTNNTYRMMKSVGSLGTGGCVQKVRLVRWTIQKYFQIGVSSIGGPDKIAP